MAWRDRLSDGASRLGGRALGTAGRTGDAFHALRALLHDEHVPSIERFLVALVGVVRTDAPTAQTARSVFEAARQRRRRLGLASLAAGPLAGVAQQLADLYCETATVCDVADLHAPGLGDREIAAHMLVLWNISDDLNHAQAMVDGTSGTGAASILSNRVVERSRTRVPDRLTATSAIRALWDARGVAGEVRAVAGKRDVRGTVFAGRRVSSFIERAERQLGTTGAPPKGPGQLS